MNIKETISVMIRDRSVVITLIAVVVMLGVIAVIAGTHIRPSDLQVPVRYSAYGITNFYRDKWYYEIFLSLFGFILAAIHVAISTRLYREKGRGFAIAFLWLTVGLLVITATLLLAILQVASLSQ